MKHIKIVLLFLLLSNFTFAQVVAHIEVDSTSALIGNPLKIKVQLSQPKSVNIAWNEIDSLDRLEILSKSKVDTIKTTDPEILLRSQTYTVTAYDSGIYIVPSFSFKYKVNGNDKEQFAPTDPLKVSYFLVPVDTTKEIKDIKPIAEVPYDWTYVIWGSFAILVLFIIGYFAYRYIQKKRALAKRLKSEIKVIIPAHEIALSALKLLEDEKIWQQGKLKLYHTSISDILRQYIFNRWSVNAMEMTSDEILQHGFVNIINGEQRELLSFVFRLADYVKFAKMLPIPKENEQSMASAISFVTSTIPVEITNDTLKSEVVS